MRVRIALVALFAFGCGRIAFDPVVAEIAQPLCVDGWCWEAPLPHGEPLFALSAVAPDDVWAAGGRGMVMHYDGTEWTTQYVGRGTYVGVAAITVTDVWVVASEGDVAHWDGSSWATQRLPDSPTSGPVPTAIWAIAANDIWVSSYDGMYSHYEGSSWATFDVASNPTSSFLSVWGSAPDDVWLVGDGVSLHYDGVGLSAGAPTGVDALVFGSARDDVWLCEVNSRVWHYDGATWTQIPTDGYLSCSGGWSPARGEAWMGGYGGAMIHATLAGTTSVEVDGVSTLRGLGGSATDAWAVGDGGRVLRFDGTQWSSVFGATTETLASVSGTANDDVWAVGRDVIMHRDRDGWTAMTPLDGSNGGLRTVHAVTRNEVYVTAEASLLRGDGTTWTEIGEPGVSYTGVWAASSTDVWALTTEAGANAVRHYDGSAWTIVPSMGQVLAAIWGTAADDVWLSTLDNNPVTGYVWHFENGSFVLRYQLPQPKWVRAFGGTSASDVWLAAGNSAALYHWDGSTIAQVPYTFPGPVTNFSGVFARSPTEAFFSTTEGRILVWDGNSISEEPEPTANRINGIWGTNDRVWVVGGDGAILSSTR